MGKTSTLGEYQQLAKAVNALANKVDKLEKSQRNYNKTIQDSNLSTSDQLRIDKEAARFKGTLNKKIIRLSIALKEQNKTWKDLGISNQQVNKAMKGHTATVERLSRAYDKAIEKGMLQVRNNRLIAGSFATARSKLLLASFAVDMIRRSIGALMLEYDELLQANLRVSNTIKTTGATALLTSFELKQMADEIEKLTTVSSTLVTEAQAVMLTFTKISGETFKDALDIAIDLSKGFGQDLKTSVIQVGKALNDPIRGVGALRRIGVSFSKTQKDMIKNFMSVNNLSGAQAVILKELKTEVGGTAEAMAETPVAKWTKLWNDLMPIIRNLGQLFGLLVDPLRQILQGIADFHNWSVKLISAWSGKDVLSKLASDADFVDKAFRRWKGTFGELTGRELKRFNELAPGLNSELLLLKNNANGGGIAVEAFKDSMQNFDNVMQFLTHDTENYNKHLERMVEQHQLLNESLNAKALLEAEIGGASDSKLKIMKLEFAFKKDQMAIEDEFNKMQEEQGPVSKQLNKEQFAMLVNRLGVSQDLFNLQKDIILAEEKSRIEREAVLLIAKQEKKDLADRIKDLKDQIKTETKNVEKSKKLKEELAEAEKKLHDFYGDLWLKRQKELMKQGNDEVKQNENKQKRLEALMNRFNILATDDYVTKLQKQQDHYVALAKTVGAGEAEITRIKNFFSQELNAHDDKNEEDRKQRLQSHYDQLQQQTSAFFSQKLSNQSSALNQEMSQDIAIAKKTSKFKAAQERGDVVEMEAIEKEAAAKTFKRRNQNFRANQLLAVANIVIDYTQAMAKEASHQGLLAFATAFPVFTAASVAAIATVMAQKPPAFAQGGDFVTSGPQNIMVGDNPGGRERVQVTPLSSPNVAGPQGGPSVTVNVSGNVLSQDFVEGELAENIKEAIRRGTDFGIS